MTLVDPISDALVNIKNSDLASKKECICRPASKLFGEILNVMKEEKYVGDFKFVEDGREGFFTVELNGTINACKAIKPRYAVKKDEFEKYEKRYLPSKDVGIIIVTTPKGVFTHKQAKENGVGGRLLAFVY